MRIIRTPARPRKAPEKGWVREGMLSALSKEPSTLTELSSGLGVSKSTASYHLSELLGRGAIEPVVSAVRRGGVQVKKYAIRPGALVLFPDRTEEEVELRKLREAFDVATLAWKSSGEGPGLVEMQELLFQLFLHLFKVTRSDHRALMEEYGSSAGALLAERIRSGNTRQTLLNLVGYLRSTRISDADLLEIPNSPVGVVVSNLCIGSDGHPGNACYFLEGIVRGVVAKKVGPSAKVGRVNVPGVSGCCLAVGRVKSLDVGWLSEAILTSPHFSAIDRGRRRVQRDG